MFSLQIKNQLLSELGAYLGKSIEQMSDFASRVNSDNDLFAIELAAAGNPGFQCKWLNEHHFYCADIPETPVPTIINPDLFKNSNLNMLYQDGIRLADDQDWDTDKVVLVTRVRGNLFVLLENKIEQITGGLFVRYDGKMLVYTSLDKYMKGMLSL